MNSFSTIVPQRAAHCPLLFYAILANSALHQSRVLGIEDERSAEYQSRCIKIMIDHMDDHEYVPDENFLAAVILLRSCEELSGKARSLQKLGQTLTRSQQMKTK